jgi:hypothetical protein
VGTLAQSLPFGNKFADRQSVRQVDHGLAADCGRRLFPTWPPPRLRLRGPRLNFGELTIKALLGHARVGVTSGYVARVDDLLLAAADKVARYVWRSMIGEAGKVVNFSSLTRSHA